MVFSWTTPHAGDVPRALRKNCQIIDELFSLLECLVLVVAHDELFFALIALNEEMTNVFRIVVLDSDTISGELILKPFPKLITQRCPGGEHH